MEALEVVEEAKEMGIRVDWFENVIGRVSKARYHQTEKVKSIKGHMEVL